jgi:rhodanese-related sulfurtransferase
VPGSINIALGGQFASWAGAVLGLSSKPVLIAKNVRGYLEGGVEAWKQGGFEVAHLPQITVQELSERIEDPNVLVLDVRRQGEWDAAHIAGADWYPLDKFKAALPLLEKDKAIAVHCKGGYRSMIASSMLQCAGYRVVNVIGGFDAWEQAQLPTTATATVGA